MHPALHRAVTLAVALCLPVAGLGAQSLPQVHVIGTGGTIGSGGDYWHGNSTRIPIEQLVQIPGIEEFATVTTEQMWNVGSSSIGPSRWLELERRVADLFHARKDLAGIVITHGTDTMEETAYFLDLTVPDRRPVVVTGSMRPSNMPGADGPANLLNAVRVAADPNARGRGTMVLMDDRLFAAREVTKTNTTRLETFQAPERGALAIVDPVGIFYHRPADRGDKPPFDVSKLDQLPRVDVVYVYPGADSVAIDAFVAAGARGLVIAGAGRGATTPEQRRALEQARDRGVVIVISSRTGSGPVPVGEGDGDDGGRAIGAGDLNPQKARVLLMLALTRTSDPKEVARIFVANQ
jgi:L-asparaginase type II